MTIAFLGCGRVGAPLADHLQRCGHQVVLAGLEASSASIADARRRNPAFGVAPPPDAVAAADVVFLATPFEVNTEALGAVEAQLTGKILVDCTNPVGPALSHGLGSAESGSAKVQRAVPGARVVKAFSIYGFENFEDNRYPSSSLLPVMLFCGDDTAAKQVVSGLIAQLGWEPLDVGGLNQALHLEHMTLLWVRMVRADGHSPNLVWAALRR